MNDRPKMLSTRVLLLMLLFVVEMPFLPLLICWHGYWWEAWTYAMFGILSFIGSRMKLFGSFIN